MPGPIVGGWPGGCPGGGAIGCWARAGEVSRVDTTSTDARIVNRFMMSPPFGALIVPLLHRLITLHGAQAAMRSVPRSVDDPLGANENNVTGTLNLLLAAREAGVRRVVYASSSSIYGGRPDLPKRGGPPPPPPLHLGGPAGPAEAGGPAARAHLALRRLQAGWRALLRGLEPPLRPGNGGPSLLQRLRPAAGPRVPVRGGHPAVHHLGAGRGTPRGPPRRDPVTRLPPHLQRCGSQPARCPRASRGRGGG